MAFSFGSPTLILPKHLRTHTHYTIGNVCRETSAQDAEGLRLLKVNFDPELVRALREVHYFLVLSNLPQDIPGPALKVHACPMSLCADIK